MTNTQIYSELNNKTFEVTCRRRITLGFTPAIISLANSSSVIHADLLTVQSITNIYICQMINSTNATMLKLF